MYRYILIFIVLVFTSCKNETSEVPVKAQVIIDNAIETAGGDRFDKSHIQFNFRDRLYTAERHNGHYKYTRLSIKDEDSVLDVLSNKGFERYLNDSILTTADSMKTRYSASVNSVHYFSILPYGLNDKAVNKERLNDEKIKDKLYHVIKVTFNQDGGGEDFEDVFLYWVDSETHKVNYLAYSYNEADGLGVRFREAYNERYVNGIRFVDYNNYKPADDNLELLSLASRFEKGELKLLSKIELEAISVTLIDTE